MEEFLDEGFYLRRLKLKKLNVPENELKER
jgi:hypothetical protein